MQHGDLPKRPVRLIGVGISDWAKEGSTQTDLFSPSNNREKDERLLQTLDEIEDRFGEGTLQLGRVKKKNTRLQ